MIMTLLRGGVKRSNRSLYQRFLEIVGMKERSCPYSHLYVTLHMNKDLQDSRLVSSGCVVRLRNTTGVTPCFSLLHFSR